MTKQEAASRTMPFGKYKGQSLDEIASSDKGLSYLDWIVGQDWFNGRIREAVEIYLDGDAMGREVEQAITTRPRDQHAVAPAESFDGISDEEDIPF